MKILLVALALLLSGCFGTEKVILRSSEVEIPPHPSAVKLCQDHPELEICKNANNSK